jgi:hypothetical protein
MAEWVVVTVSNMEERKYLANDRTVEIKIVKRARTTLQEQAITQNTSHQQSHEALKIQ